MQEHDAVAKLALLEEHETGGELHVAGVGADGEDGLRGLRAGGQRGEEKCGGNAEEHRAGSIRRRRKVPRACGGADGAENSESSTAKCMAPRVQSTRGAISHSLRPGPSALCPIC